MTGEVVPFHALLGDEYDRPLILRAFAILTEMGAREVRSLGFVAGSQDVVIREWEIDGQTLRFESETYVGFSVEGAEAPIRALVARLEAEGFPRGEL
jgi:hypothetical protein